MKYLKTFEELSPETYKSAADKLVARGETERADVLNKYIESPFYKHYVDKMRRDPGFKKYIDGLKADPKMKEALSKINPESDVKEIYTLINKKELIKKILEDESQVFFSDMEEEEKKARITRALKRFGIGTVVGTGLAIALIAMGHSDWIGFQHEMHNMSQMVDASIASFVTTLLSNAVIHAGMAVASRPKDEEPTTEEDF